MTAGSILVVGEAIGDFIPRDADGRAYEVVLGGSGFNVALALARFDASVSYAAALSTDALGRRFRAAIAAEGIDASMIGDSASPSAIAVVAPLGPEGVPEFGLYLDSTAHAEPTGTPRICPAGTLHVHAASFGATHGPSGEATLALIESARAQGASVSYDVNIRPSALPPRAEALLLIEQRVARADLVKASLDDLIWMYPGEEPEIIVRHWRRLGAGYVLLTRGPHGATAYGPAEAAQATPLPVAISDTVGAGDTFIGGMLAVLAARGRLGPGLPGLTHAELQAALRFACAVAADTCTRPGCDPPRRSAREAT